MEQNNTGVSPENLKNNIMETKNLFTALAAFQQEVPAIHKGSKGYGYSYASLPEILEVINPLLKFHGLGFTQLLDDEFLTTIIFHCQSGESIKSRVHIPQGVNLKGMNDFQVMGSAITYYRRYSLSAAFGLITDVDNDGAGQQQGTATKRPEQKTRLDNLTPPLSSAIAAYAVKGFEPDQIIKKMEEKFILSDSVKKIILNGHPA
jgi:hypothetical protein